MRRCFTVNAHIEIRDEDGHIMHEGDIVGGDIWNDGGVYKTYLKCLKYAKDELLVADSEHNICPLVCKICPICKRTEKGN